MEASKIMVQEISKLTNEALAKRWFEAAGLKAMDFQYHHGHLVKCIQHIVEDETTCFRVVVPEMKVKGCHLRVFPNETPPHGNMVSFAKYIRGHFQGHTPFADHKDLCRAIVEAAVRALMEAKNANE
jgi:hypothetical protein